MRAASTSATTTAAAAAATTTTTSRSHRVAAVRGLATALPDARICRLNEAERGILQHKGAHIVAAVVGGVVPTELNDVRCD